MKSAFLSLGRGISKSSLAFACLMLVLSACLGMFQVVTRFVFEQPAEWSEVLIRFFLIWMVFMALPEAFRLGSMVSIDMLHRLSPPPLRRILDVVIMVASLALLAVIIWFGWDYAQRGKVQTMAGLEDLSMFWAYLALPVGSVCAVFGVISNFLEPQKLELETAQ
ncbi:TRAP transporter small permease [Noviherbaspirillum malthae]|jgi:TRAP-type C4-dicarboxylate transport system permease small subunit|uniref:TRAP transporter small permease n=1 Tax=Noviherbaspirillum malthae TaxID=1260987 RepID=UPI00188F1F98|nr:TRAP transporter small permease [Noviherbaspirillum malthae]